ncbi:L-serine ammonia-lyase [Oceanomicrobium pacificus]|uniref:L-serine dehydratase n=1 Tax=Oceanomicrobium pacificus TaxID=2692916 RepID=A0A6B0TWA3_9RHOB|nr:L-serine ammonia-lyase [Oceanomicrobium pacificus]MXU65532.1 L-serine ammonia-lyase [Oceanomicrobium pacificus]
MFLSVFDIFKVGIGPSSSHTMGPMVAGGRFLDLMRRTEGAIPGAGPVTAVDCKLHGSLAFTGKGHATDRATILGLAGFRPDDFDADAAETELDRIDREKMLHPEGLPPLRFDPETDIIFDYGPPLPGHANGMVVSAYDARGVLARQETYYSVGGGFVLTPRELEDGGPGQPDKPVPYPFHSALEMLRMARASGKSIADMKRANERVHYSGTDLDADIAALWAVMDRSIERGLSRDGTLPGGLNLRRRAKGIHDALQAEFGRNQTAPHVVNDWISVFAIAVNEENAAGGQVVTAPTNGAAGVLPATLRYWLQMVPGAHSDRVPDFLLTAAAIGGLIKTNASISGAEVGCQGEVGSASAMAAAGLCAVLGGSPEQVENAAEIALEHHLGMTCDPIRGLVQAPCIERNGLGAIKAVSAASMALRGDGQHLVSLDACIETMRQTGLDMNSKYKETSLGGLAVNVPSC